MARRLDVGKRIGNGGEKKSDLLSCKEEPCCVPVLRVRNHKTHGMSFRVQASLPAGQPAMRICEASAPKNEFS